MFGIFLGVVCPASAAVARARLLGAHCRHSYAEIPGSVKLTYPENRCHIMRRLENWKHEDLAYQGYTYSLESNQGSGPCRPRCRTREVDGLGEGAVLVVRMGLGVGPACEETLAVDGHILLDLMGLGSTKLKTTKPLNKGFVFVIFSIVIFAVSFCFQKCAKVPAYC